MAEFKALDDATFRAAAARGQKTYASPRAVSARYDKRRGRVLICLDTGIELAFDPKRTPELATAEPEDLAGVLVEGVGSTLHFPKFDADFTVSRLIENFLGPLDWTRREARALASRENGKLGGRPKRTEASRS